MKKMTTRFATALLLGVLCAAPAFAKAKSLVLTVGQDFVVGATTVKAGTYLFSVDSESNELTVLNKKSKEVVARVQTQAQARDKGPFRFEFQLVENNGTQTLTSIAFDGEKSSYTIAGSSAAAR